MVAAGYGASLSLVPPYPPLKNNISSSNNVNTTTITAPSSSRMSSFLPRNYQNATMPHRSMAAQRLALLARTPSSSSLKSTDSGGGLKKPGGNKRRAGVKRCVSFSDERPSIQRIDSVKSLLAEPLDERQHSHQGAAVSMNDLWYDSVELETAKNLSAQLVLSIEQGTPNHTPTSSRRSTDRDNKDEEVEDLRGLERQTTEGSWQHFQNRAKALGAVLDTKPQNPDELASLASEATEEARLIAQQRALQDEKEALEYLSDVRDSLSSCSNSLHKKAHTNNHNIMMMVGASDDEISVASSCTEDDPLDNDDHTSKYRYTPGRAASGSSLRGPKSSVGLDFTNAFDNPPALRRQVTANYYSKTPPPCPLATTKNSIGSDKPNDKPKVSASASFSVPRRPVAGSVNHNSTAAASDKPKKVSASASFSVPRRPVAGSDKPKVSASTSFSAPRRPAAGSFNTNNSSLLDKPKVSASASFSVPRRPVGGSVNNNSSLLDKPKVSASASFSAPRRPVGGGLASNNKYGVSKPLESEKNAAKKDEEAQSSKANGTLLKQQQKEVQKLAKQHAKLEALKKKAAAPKKNADDDASVGSNSSSSSGSSSSSSSSNSSSSSAHRPARPRVVADKRQCPPPRSQSTVHASTLTTTTSTSVKATGVVPTRSHSAPKKMLPSTNKLASAAATSAGSTVRKPPQRTSSTSASVTLRKAPIKKPPQRSCSMGGPSASSMAASINKKYLPSNTGGRATLAMQRIPRRRPAAAGGGDD